MKIKRILFCFLACFIALCAEEPKEEEVVAKEKPGPVRNSFIHLDMGSGPFPLPLPTFAIGFRKQSGHQGIDLSLHASTVVYITQIKLTPAYLFYLNPGLKGQLYVGAGVGGGVLIQSPKNYDRAIFSLSPELILGKEYIGRTGSYRLFQVQISVPSYNFGKVMHLPNYNFEELKKLSKKNRVLYYPLIVVSYGICF
jgi:hypothetical protein